MNYRDLLARLNDAPFKPFRIKLSTSTTVDVVDPTMIMVGRTSAIVATRIAEDDRGYKLALDWKTISILHIVEITDLPVKPERERKRKGA